ncbi:MAG: hypothetical protein LBQ93_00660 [Treponema sp.]|nr:hypothetical protein [Treponema sp.]
MAITYNGSEIRGVFPSNYPTLQATGEIYFSDGYYYSSGGMPKVANGVVTLKVYRTTPITSNNIIRWSYSDFSGSDQNVTFTLSSLSSGGTVIGTVTVSFSDGVGSGTFAASP